MTKLNKTILETLRNSEGHMTADEMFMYCKENDIKVSLASVYRILGSLADNGYIRRISVDGQSDVFDKTLTEHQHMFCSSCGRVTDLQIENFKELLEKNAGVEVESYELNLRYTCPNCRA